VGSYNTAIGYQALEDFVADANNHGLNTAVGYQAGKTISTGTSIVAIGSGAMSSGVTTANEIVAIGEGAAAALTSGGQNIAIGRAAMDEHTTGGNNISIGVNSMTATQAGGTQATSAGSADNIFIGRNSGGGDWADVASNKNLAIGNYTLDAVMNGALGNTCIGYAAGTAITTGDSNTFVGQDAGSSVTTGAENVTVGNGSGPADVGNSNCIVLGSGVGGASNDFSFGKASNVVTNDFDTNADWARLSDERKKRNIENDTLGLEFINDLRTVTFQWKPAEEHPEEWEAWHYEKDEDGNNVGDKIYDEMNTDSVMHGMIAQEVKAALDVAGVDTFGGWKLKDPENADGQQLLSSGMFVFPLIKAVQELSAKVTALENA
jgi:hypothetical protein